MHYYFGRGKGKTTAALGLAMRAAGHGMRALVVQFMKTSNRYGELRSFRKLGDRVEIRQMGRPCRNPARDENGFVCDGCMLCHVDPSAPDPEDVECARHALEAGREALASGDYELVILDEAGYAVEMGLVAGSSVVEALSSRAEDVEAVVTGGARIEELVEASHYASEFVELKHHYQDGISEVMGIDY